MPSSEATCNQEKRGCMLCVEFVDGNRFGG